MSAQNSEVTDLSSLLDALEGKVQEDGSISSTTFISLEDVLELIGRRAYGPILLIIGLLALSPVTVIPGATWLFAALTLVICAQMMLHKDHPWMPKKALALKLSETKVSKFVESARPTARFIDRFIRPRFTFLSKPPWAFGVAFLCALAALISFPLGLVPFLPMAPALAIAFFGLGLTARDGLMLALGSVLVCGAFWFVFTKLF